MKYDIVIIGAGISGIVLAERYATIKNKKVLIIEKRNHIGGNCFDFINNEGILVPKYGPHFFHTNKEEVWRYINKFSEWIPYEHRVLSSVDGKLVPIPVNITTVNELFKLNIKNEKEMIAWLSKNVEKIDEPKNSKESALSRVGKGLYDKLFKEYTKKQWDLWPEQLAAEVMDRIPVRTTFDDRYFVDKYQFMPKSGYAKLFEKMVDSKNIKILLNTKWEDYKKFVKKFEKLYFTGPIDQFFNYDLGEKLEYRSLMFKFDTIQAEHYQEVTTINYPSINTLYTRITEPKYSTGQKSNITTIITEYPRWEGEPYYPVPTIRNQELYKKYQEKAKKLEKDNIYFVGRLANYKYFNMDQAFENALNIFNNLEE